MSSLKCKKHGIDKEPMGGESAHPSNWYCPKCEDEFHEIEDKTIHTKEYDPATHRLVPITAPREERVRISGNLGDDSLVIQISGLVHVMDELGYSTHHHTVICNARAAAFSLPAETTNSVPVSGEAGHMTSIPSGFYGDLLRNFQEISISYLRMRGRIDKPLFIKNECEVNISKLDKLIEKGLKYLNNRKSAPQAEVVENNEI